MIQHRWYPVVAVLAALSFPARLPAPGGCTTCSPIFPDFGLVAVSSQDKVRLNLLNVLQPDAPRLPACVVQASLLEAQTTPPCFDCVPPPPLAQETLTLNPGQAGAIEFTPTLTAPARQSLRAVLQPQDPIRCRNVVATLEVFDVATGRLSALLPGDPMHPTDPMFLRFGLMGITASDTVRLNVVNGLLPVDPILPSDPCRVQASFVAAPASTCIDCLPPSPLAQTSLVLMPGQAGALDYSPTLAFGARQSVRPVLTPQDPIHCQNAVATLEVFDRTAGRTFVLIPNDPMIPTDPMLPDFGVVGVSSQDKVRLNVLNAHHPSDPIIPQACVVQASLVEAQTAFCSDCPPPSPLAQDTLTLNPGQAGAIEFTPTLTAPARQSLRAVLQPQDPMRCQNVVATLEVFDVATGRLSALLPQDPIHPADPMFLRLGLMGITGSDTVRLNVVNPLQPGHPIAPRACLMQASLVAAPVCIDFCSSPVLAQDTLTLNPGQAGAIEFTPALAFGDRQSLRAVLHPTDPMHCQNAVATLEVFDNTAGRTFVLLPSDPMAPAP